MCLAVPFRNPGTYQLISFCLLLYFYFGSFIRFPRLPWFIFIISTCFKGLTYYYFHLLLFLLPCWWLQFVKILFIHLLKPIYELTKIVSNYIFHIVLWLQNCNMDFFYAAHFASTMKVLHFFPESYINSFSCLQFSFKSI